MRFGLIAMTLFTTYNALGFSMTYSWRKRVLKCSQSLFASQQSVLNGNSKLSKDLKLTVIESDRLKSKCQLIGLDGGVKEVKTNVFTMKELETIINAMPMRARELKSRI